MKYAGKNKELGLPDYIIFGIEIEANNVKTKNGLYDGESGKYIEELGWHKATGMEESLVKHGGAELVSPKLKDEERTYENIESICNQIKKYPLKDTEAVADEKCGLHIHFDSECLRKDPRKMKAFRKITAEAEELIYKMCNEKGNPIRKDAISKKYNGLNLISSLWRKGMAVPTGKKVLKKIEKGTLKVSYKKFGILRRNVVSKYKLDERRYAGLNLTNVGNPNKNTVEFRMANGTLDPNVIKQNVFLYASIIKTAVEMVDNPEKYTDRLEKFYNRDVTEKEKAENFLDLIMDSEEDKKIYMDRWESVKDSEIFKDANKRRIFPETFKKDDFKDLSRKVARGRITQVYNMIKDVLTNTKEKGEMSGDAR